MKTSHHSARVAIVIPCFNVERYLDECLQSAVDQTHSELEIIVVNDGSTDATGETIERWAANDSRITPIHQENKGLGAARNVGIRAADADFLTFLDSDDLLPLSAIDRMVEMAATSGSDLVSGVAERFNSTRAWKSSMYRSPFDSRRTQTHVYYETQLLYDHIACSKLFRSNFWHENGFVFPEGVLFEDIELVTRAHCLAASVDLESEPTYLWRDREDDSPSITQDRTAPGSTAARFEALTRLDGFLGQTAPSAVWDAHASKAFSLDVLVYSRLIPDHDESFLDEFVVSAGHLAAAASPAGIDNINFISQMLFRGLRDSDQDTVRAWGYIASGTATHRALRVRRGIKMLSSTQRAEASVLLRSYLIDPLKK